MSAHAFDWGEKSTKPRALREIARAALAGAVRRFNAIRGGRRIANSPLARAICGNGPAVANLRCGADAIVLLQDHIGRTMYLWGQHDPRVAHVMETLIGPGDTVLDIGANFGVLGLLAAHHVGKQGKVHLFEPQPLLAQCLRASLILNGYTNAEVHECALSSRSGFAEMAIVEPANLGMTRIVSHDSELPGHRVRVRVENAADYIRALPDCRPAVVKIDVEGHEGEILKALQAWMSEIVPGFVLLECHVGKAGFWNEDSVRVLAELNYQFFTYDLTRYWETRLQRVPAHEQVPAGYDFVAVHPTALETPAGLRLQRMITNET